jgi:hypothetical protein
MCLKLMRAKEMNSIFQLQDQVMQDGVSSSSVYEDEDNSLGREPLGGHTPDNW